MKIFSTDLEGTLDACREVPRLLQAGEPDSALDFYLSRYAELPSRARLEWGLASALHELGRAEPRSGWPVDLLERPSGGTLAFVVSQIAGVGLPLPGALASRRPVPPAFRAVLAASWLRRPLCAALQDEATRSRFALWLAETPSAIGSCLLAAAEAGDEGLAQHLAPLWLRRGLHPLDAPEQIARVSRFPFLAPVAREALRAATVLFFGDAGALLRLLETAFHLGDPGSALPIGEALLNRELNEAERRKVLALGLAALADLDRVDEVIERYHSRWLPTGAPFPWPERLLYAFQQRGESDLERHLLTTAPPEAETLPWVSLSRDLILGEQPPRRAHLEAWEALYRERPRDERVLVGATSAILRCSPLLREEWAERLGLRKRWESLHGQERYRDLAGAFLVLLCTADEERIETFEDCLAGAELSLEPTRRAARAYVAALRRRKRWDRLRDLDARWPDLFDLACRFRERELARGMVRVTDLPASPADLRRWCSGWERLLGLPLASGEVLEILDHFLALRREVERRDREGLEGGLLKDLSLQILRRARAEAELSLRHARPSPLAADPGRRLGQSSLEAVFSMLQEIHPTAEIDVHVE